jgi:hypothetical protein
VTRHSRHTSDSGREQGFAPAADNEPTGFEHDPVLLGEVVHAFGPCPAGWVFDGTAGGGGHSAALLDAHPHLRVIGGDRDPAAVLATIAALAPRAMGRRGATDDHAAWLEQLLADPPVASPTEHPAEHRHIHDDECRHPDNTAHGIDSVSVTTSDTFDLEELEDQLAALPGNYVRIKGILRAIDGRTGAPAPGWTVIHRVGPRVSSEPFAAPDLERGRIVALGPGVSVSAISACLAAARA